MEDNEVLTSFEILLEEIESVIDALNNKGAEYFHKSAYEEANKIIEEARGLTAFRAKVKQLQNEWEILEKKENRQKTKSRDVKKTVSSRLKRGLRTPENEFRLPVLAAIAKLGGSAPIGDVLSLVEKNMSNQLNEYDLQHLPSTGASRWRNTAQWARQTLIDDGYLANDSPHGVWEITNKGREILKVSTLKHETNIDNSKNTKSNTSKQFVNLILREHFGTGFSKVGRLRLMFESDSQIVYFQNYNKETDRLWYRLSKKPWKVLDKTQKQGWLCLTYPVERFVYILPVKEIKEKIRQYEWEKEDIEISIYPLVPRNETLWHEFKWKIEKYRHEYK